MSALPFTAGEFRRNSRETVRVQITEYHGRAIVNLRCWFTDGGGELKPGRDGLALSVSHLPALADAVAKALAEAQRRGLLSDEGSTDGSR